MPVRVLRFLLTGQQHPCQAVMPAACGQRSWYLVCVQIGWVTGPLALMKAVTSAHQFLIFTVPSSLQRAVAYGLDNESSFYT